MRKYSCFFHPKDSNTGVGSSNYCTKEAAARLKDLQGAGPWARPTRGTSLLHGNKVVFQCFQRLSHSTPRSPFQAHDTTNHL